MTKEKITYIVIMVILFIISFLVLFNIISGKHTLIIFGVSFFLAFLSDRIATVIVDKLYENTDW